MLPTLDVNDNHSQFDFLTIDQNSVLQGLLKLPKDKTSLDIIDMDCY